jgi:hypothetical protein
MSCEMLTLREGSPNVFGAWEAKGKMSLCFWHLDDFTGFFCFNIVNSEPLWGPVTKAEWSGTLFSLPADRDMVQQEGGNDRGQGNALQLNLSHLVPNLSSTKH